MMRWKVLVANGGSNSKAVLLLNTSKYRDSSSFWKKLAVGETLVTDTMAFSGDLTGDRFSYLKPVKFFGATEAFDREAFGLRGG
jgi:hypothetical protein